MLGRAGVVRGGSSGLFGGWGRTRAWAWVLAGMLCVPASDGVAGPKSRRSAVTPPPADPIQALSVWRASGELDAKDSVLPSGEYHAVHRFEATRGQALLVDLSSGTFSTYVGLVSPTGQVWENDAYSRIGHSRVHALADADGTYTVVVTSLLPDEVGAYLLQVGVGHPDGQAVVEAFGALNDTDAPSPDEPAVDSYAFSARAGDRLAAWVFSDAFAPVVHLQSPDGTVLAPDAGARPGSDPVAYTATSDGLHQLVVGRPSKRDSGPYSAQVVRLDSLPHAPSGDKIGVAFPALGTLDATDLQREGVGPVDTLRFFGRRGERVVVDLTSQAFPPFLVVSQPSGASWANAGAGGGGGHARLSQVLRETGQYTIQIASAQEGLVGDWRVELQQQPGPEDGREPSGQPAPDKLKRVFGSSTAGEEAGG